jgi:ribosome biogenesis GTPase
LKLRARVVANFRSAVALQDAQTNVVGRAVSLSRVPLLVAGDQVRYERDDGGTLRVTDLEPRDSVLERVDRRGQLKPLAANLTHLAIVTASKPGFDRLLIDQFCLAAHRAGVDAMVVVNKSDLLDADERVTVEGWLSIYRSIGYPALMIDTVSESAMQPLLGELPGRTVVLAGASGVGKSSIVKRLLPDLEVRVGAISEATGFGAHTTTVTYWYALPGNAAIIDSPGVRQFSVAHLTPADVRAGYLEIARTAQACRFANCAHTVEPECAVRDAVASGDISRWRYDNYLKLLG